MDEIRTKKKFFEACWVLQHFAVKVSDREIGTHFFEKKKNYAFKLSNQHKNEEV